MSRCRQLGQRAGSCAGAAPVRSTAVYGTIRDRPVNRTTLTRILPKETSTSELDEKNIDLLTYTVVSKFGSV
jgi:hypothetical protein